MQVLAYVVEYAFYSEFPAAFSALNGSDMRALTLGFRKLDCVRHLNQREKIIACGPILFAVIEMLFQIKVFTKLMGVYCSFLLV